MKDDHFLEVRNRTVRKANVLIQKSRFDLSLQQQKIVLYLISQITPYDEDFKEYEFSINEFCKVCGIDNENGGNYKYLKETIKKIYDKSMWVTIIKNGKEVDKPIRWIQEPQIIKQDGIIKMRLDEDMKPFLLHLKKNFTSYEILWTLHFRSKYTIRLYELIKSIHFHELETYKRRFDLDDLKRMLEGERYKEYKGFKRRILIPAVKEINEYSDKNVTVEEIKSGQRVAAIEFTVSSKDSLEAVRIRSEIEKEFGLNQLTLWEQLEEKGLV